MTNGDPRVSACLSVGLSLLCLGWPCFRFRGFEKSWLGWGEGSLGRYLGSPGQWEEHLVRCACGVWLPRREPGAARTPPQCWGHLRPGLRGCTHFTSHMLWRKMKQTISQ